MNNMEKNNYSKIDKILNYILGVKPDEFFLIPDDSGYVKIKELIKALSQTNDLKWITKSKILGCSAGNNEALIEIKNNYIRSRFREKITLLQPAENIPGQLYTCIRKKAWKHIFNKGLFPKDSKIILTKKKKDALLIGKRIDNDPVLLYVSASSALNDGIEFLSFGSDIFLVDFLKKDMFKGPSIEKTIEVSHAKQPAKPKIFSPGTFIPKSQDIFPMESKTKSSKDNSWKKNKKKFRKEKTNFWPDQ